MQWIVSRLMTDEQHRRSDLSQKRFGNAAIQQAIQAGSSKGCHGEYIKVMRIDIPGNCWHNLTV